MLGVSERQPIHDPTMLRAIAHPVRNRILTELTARGPMRAADLARELDLPANQMSFHLRQLAKYGLVEEDPAAARDRRDRVWRPAAPDGVTVNLSELEQQPGGKAASQVFRRHAASWGHVVVDAAYTEERDPSVLRSVNENAVRLTRDEAVQLSAEIDDVLTRWVERTRGLDDDRRTYLLFSVLQPYPGDPEGAEGTA